MICEYGGPGELEYVVAEDSESGLGGADCGSGFVRGYV
jgi:hypothetical protein